MRTHPVIASLFGLLASIKMFVFLFLLTAGSTGGGFSDEAGAYPNHREEVLVILLVAVLFVLYYASGVWAALTIDKRRRSVLAKVAHGALACGWIAGALMASDIVAGLVGVGFYVAAFALLPTLLWLWLLSPDEKPA